MLRRLYVDEQKSLADIGRIYGKHPNQVLRWMKAYDIPRRDIRTATMLTGKYGVHSEAHRETLRKNIALARTKITPASREKWRLKMYGRKPPNKGVPWTQEQRDAHMAARSTPEYREKLAAAHRGEKSYNWKGGVKSELARRLDTSEWRRIRREVYERDNWTCQDCEQRCLNTKDSRSRPKLKIQAHHIVSRRDGGSDEIENLVTLCMSCHHKRERAGR